MEKDEYEEFLKFKMQMNNSMKFNRKLSSEFFKEESKRLD